MISIRQILEAYKKKSQDLSYLTSSTDEDEDDDSKNPPKSKNNIKSVTPIKKFTVSEPVEPSTEPIKKLRFVPDPSKLTTLSNKVAAMKRDQIRPDQTPKFAPKSNPISNSGYAVINTTRAGKSAPNIQNPTTTQRYAVDNAVGRAAAGDSANGFHDKVYRARTEIKRREDEKKNNPSTNDIKNNIFGNKLAVPVPQTISKPKYKVSNTSVPVRPQNFSSVSTSNNTPSFNNTNSPTNSSQYDDSFHNGLSKNKSPTQPSVLKPKKNQNQTTPNINLMSGREYEKQQNRDNNSIGTKIKKTFKNFKDRGTPKSPEIGDMNLLDGRRYQQQATKDKQNAILQQQKLNSRNQDKENYIKIKKAIKPHLANAVEKIKSRNYWRKDIKPGLETIANAFKR